ncbi:MAG: hypothetical protein OEY24_00640 [Candidatus Bathyarchaeota archaeon]|nr:hypothetical protein [Candidatus Bathyarchaeota archaeon]MDH5494201.1 hypothetical protein [Candidatus Bathyarchaeota archaeon]
MSFKSVVGTETTTKPLDLVTLFISFKAKFRFEQCSKVSKAVVISNNFDLNGRKNASALTMLKRRFIFLAFLVAYAEMSHPADFSPTDRNLLTE